MRKCIIFFFCALSSWLIAQETYQYRYWFDTADNIAQVGISSNSAFHLDIDASSLSTGLHTLNYQIIDTIGESTPHTAWFYKLLTYGEITATILLDGKPTTAYELKQINNSLIHIDVDASKLPMGLHTISIQLVNDFGVVSPVLESYFIKAAAINDDTKLYYSTDNQSPQSVACTFIDGVAHFDLDMSSLSTGLHTLNFFLANNIEVLTPVKTAFFMKEPFGGKGISFYRYWINDHQDECVVQEFSPPQSLVQFTQLLEVPQDSLRSSNFHFTIEDSVPIIYPKNRFYLQARNSLYLYTWYSKEYVDVTLPKVLEADVFRTLTSGKNEAINDLGENEIEWFKFKAKDGDSISIHTDRTCTIEIFGPDANRVYKAEGYNSVHTKGIFLSQTGEYYVAIHDITDSNTKNTTVHFYQMDRYAIREYDVHKVGDAGFATITFRGNGYYSLDSVNLTLGTDTISTIDLQRISNTILEATFDFGGVPLGEYDLNFYFVDENKTIVRGLLVEEAIAISLTNTMQYSSTYLVRSDKPHFDVSVTNHGNNTAYRVPIYIYVETPLSEELPTINIKGIHLDKLMDGIDLSELTPQEQQQLEELSAQVGDNLHFIRLKGTDEITGDSILVSSNYFFVDIPPYSTKNISIVITTEQSVKCYTTIPDQWMTFSNHMPEIYVRRMATNANTVKESFCCYHERVECVLDAVGTVAGFIPGAPASVISCATSMLSSISGVASNVFCGEGGMPDNALDWLNFITNKMSLAETVRECIIGDEWGKKWEILSKLAGFTQTGFATNSCLTSFMTEKPGCPPNPPKGGSSNPVQSLDPNDILGYVSQSGSHYVGLQQKRLNYTIEFENDSTLATSAAYQITLVDSLSPNIFDVNSIYTSKVKIGKYEVDVNKQGAFVTTIDLRPDIDALAELKLDINKEGRIQYTFTSLDPMTIQPTNELGRGLLPVNNANHDGEGYVTFDIQLQDGLSDGTIIDNQASIIFDMNDAIITPTWSNETDYVLPISYVKDIEILDESHIQLNFAGIDERSGIWKYDLYYQIGSGSKWILLEENLLTTSYSLEVQNDINYGFCVIATDMAGNREEKELSREYSYHNGYIVTQLEEVQPNDMLPHTELYDVLGRKIYGKPQQSGVYIMKGKKVFLQ